MLPTSTSRYAGGITRVAFKSKGGYLERNATQSLSPDAVDLMKHNSGPVTADSSAPLAEAYLWNGRSTSISHTDTSLVTRLAPKLTLGLHRGFHTSPRIPYDSTSYGMTDVPDFLIKYKEHRATCATDSVNPEAQEDERGELGLMQSLASSILSGDVVASTRRVEAKIPVEHQVAEGHIIHPSGFVVPGPGHTSTSHVARAKEKERDEDIDRALQTAAVADRVLESDFEQVDASTLPSSHKVPFEVREPDGTVKHPSGFVPPTPAHEFRYPVDMLRKASSERR